MSAARGAAVTLLTSAALQVHLALTSSMADVTTHELHVFPLVYQHRKFKQNQRRDDVTSHQNGQYHFYDHLAQRSRPGVNSPVKSSPAAVRVRSGRGLASVTAHTGVWKFMEDLAVASTPGEPFSFFCNKIGDIMFYLSNILKR